MTRITLLFRALAVTMVAGSLTVSGCSCSGNDGQFPVDGGPDDSTVGMDATTPPDGEGGDGDGPDGSGGDGGETGNDGGGTEMDAGLGDGGFIDPCDTDSGIICLGDGGLPDSGVPGCPLKPCMGKVYQCGNCLDDDMDGRIDDADPNCLNPCDNNEAGFDLQIPGNPLSGCGRDCYFDDNSGSGNDGCSWALQCDPLAPVKDCCSTRVHVNMCQPSKEYKTRNCSDTPEQDPLCHQICMPIVPNGCDCFGCCDIRTLADPEAANWVYIGSFDETQSGSKIGTCDIEKAQAGDHAACRPCTPLEECLNPCGLCELCLGKTTLPDICFPPPPPPPVDAGVDAAVPDAGTPPPPRCTGARQPCGLPGDDPCPQSAPFCQTGCCIWVG
jgi:hypothetical protein